MEQQKKFLVTAAYWAVWGAAAVLFLKYVFPVLLPFFAAFFVAWLLCRPVDAFAEKMHMKRGIAAVLGVVLFYGGLAGVVSYTCVAIYRLLCRGALVLPDVFSKILFPVLQGAAVWMEGMFYGIYPAGDAKSYGTLDVMAAFGEMLSGVSSGMLGKMSQIAAGIPAVCMDIMIAIIATVFLELEYHAVIRFIRHQIPEQWQHLLRQGKTEVAGVIKKCAISYGLLLLLTFAELFAGLLVLGVDGAFVIAIIIAFLDLLPVIGTGTVLVPWCIAAFVLGDGKLGVGLFALWLVITVVRNILEPKLVGKQIGLSPVVTLPCMLLGLQFFGLVGLFAVPAAVTCIKSLNDQGVIHIFKGTQGNDKRY